MDGMNEAEQRFADYLDAHGYDWAFEPDYQAQLGLSEPLRTEPDFLVRRNDLCAVSEVRQFESSHIRDAVAKAGGHSSLGPKVVYGALRSVRARRRSGAALARRTSRRWRR
jgi:hypothetical protein